MSYLIFFDIDGVLTSNRQQIAQNKNELWSKFDPVALEFFNRIHDTYKNVNFVCISTWKNNLPNSSITDDNTELNRGNYVVEHWVLSSMRNSGFRGELAPYWKTLNESVLDRASGIKHYLSYNPVNDFIIFDDNDYDFYKVLGKKRWVQTHSNDGILTKHMLNALALMGTWDKK